MGEESNQIERRIRTERAQLGQNLNELQAKVQEVTDWRAQFQKRPMLMIGAAVGGGVLLASITGGKAGSRRYYAQDRDAGARPEHRRGTEYQKSKALETFDNIKGAMIAVAANTFQDFLGQLIPGFREQVHKTAHEKRSNLALEGTTPTRTASTQ